MKNKENSLFNSFNFGSNWFLVKIKKNIIVNLHLFSNLCEHSQHALLLLLLLLFTLIGIFVSLLLMPRHFLFKEYIIPCLIFFLSWLSVARALNHNCIYFSNRVTGMDFISKCINTWWL